MTTIRNTQRTALGAAALATALLGAGASMLQAQTYSSTPVVLNAGTVIPVTLNSEISSNQAQVGDTFTANVDDSKQAYNRILQGATLDGVVRRATPQSGDTPGTLDLAFTRLHLSDGRTVTITGSPASLETKDLTTRSDGVMVAKTSSQDKRLTYAGYGAGAGLLVGLLTGKKIKIEDILIGGALGYGAGSVLKSPQQVHDVDLKQGTEIGVRLDSRTRYYHKTPKVVTKRVHRIRHTVHHNYAH